VFFLGCQPSGDLQTSAIQPPFLCVLLLHTCCTPLMNRLVYNSIFIVFFMGNHPHLLIDSSLHLQKNRKLKSGRWQGRGGIENPCAFLEGADWHGCSGQKTCAKLNLAYPYTDHGHASICVCVCAHGVSTHAYF
jgi:hypothetical protein